MADDVLLSIEELHAGYGPIRALHGISLEVRSGEIVTIIGGNGAGKSTTLRAISGVIRPSAGRICFAGEPIERLSPDQIVQLGLSHSPEGRQVFPQMTVRENLELGAYTRRDRQAIAGDLRRMEELFPILGQRCTQPAGTLSGGEQQMLAMARALMSRPRLLMLDEPSLGLAPIIVQKIFAVIRELNAAGTAILLVEQNARQALKLAARGYVLETGTIKLAGTGADLLADPRVNEAYLGA